MCLAFPGKIISIKKDHKAVVNFEGIEKEINTFLISEPKIGEYVLVHAGFAIQKISQEDAFESLEALKVLE
jgi:hydrogenase expression/formation protein HypC